MLTLEQPIGPLDGAHDVRVLDKVVKESPRPVRSHDRKIPKEYAAICAAAMRKATPLPVWTRWIRGGILLAVIVLGSAASAAVVTPSPLNPLPPKNFGRKQPSNRRLFRLNGDDRKCLKKSGPTCPNGP